MSPNQFVKWGIGLWLFCLVGSVVHAALHQPGPGYLTVLENVFIFAAWQIAALVVAFGVMIARLVAHQSITGALRWLGFVPIVLSGGFTVFVTLWFWLTE